MGSPCNLHVHARSIDHADLHAHPHPPTCRPRPGVLCITDLDLGSWGKRLPLFTHHGSASPDSAHRGARATLSGLARLLQMPPTLLATQLKELLEGKPYHYKVSGACRLMRRGGAG